MANRSKVRHSCALLLLWVISPLGFAKDPDFIEYSDDTIAITQIQLVDGTGSPAKTNQTIIIENGRFKALLSQENSEISPKIRVIDGQGKTMLPGLVMMHEHLFYPTGNRNYTEMLFSFPKLYLAGGVTSMRTAGTMAPYADLNLRDAIAQNVMLGPDIDVTAPYLNGPGLPILKVNALGGVDDADRMVRYWADEGVSSYKAYMHIRRDELARVIEIAHQKKHKVTAHLCSITYREAAELGIDNLEHGFFVATDFVADKKPDVCPDRKAVAESLANLDTNSQEVKELIQLLVKKNVAITSTLTIFETYTPGRPLAYPEALKVLLPQVREQYETTWEKVSQNKESLWGKIFANAMKLERMFVEAGGTLIVGTDPTGYGGVVAGFASKRVIELLVEAGFSFEQAIYFASLEGAKYLGRDAEIGSIEVGKRADFVLVDGDPVKNTQDIRNISTVFKSGIGYNAEKIISSLEETVGLH